MRKTATLVALLERKKVTTKLPDGRWEFDGQIGVWKTTPSGMPIFIPDEEAEKKEPVLDKPTEKKDKKKAHPLALVGSPEKHKGFKTKKTRGLLTKVLDRLSDAFTPKKKPGQKEVDDLVDGARESIKKLKQAKKPATTKEADKRVDAAGRLVKGAFKLLAMPLVAPFKPFSMLKDSAGLMLQFARDLDDLLHRDILDVLGAPPSKGKGKPAPRDKEGPERTDDADEIDDALDDLKKNKPGDPDEAVDHLEAAYGVLHSIRDALRDREISYEEAEELRDRAMRRIENAKKQLRASVAQAGKSSKQSAS